MKRRVVSILLQSILEVPSISTPPLASVLFVIYAMFLFYTIHCTFISSEAYSSPSIVIASTNRDGSRAILDDYREAYYWMRMNTDEHAKFLSWWDYGYQMAGMGNRSYIIGIRFNRRTSLSYYEIFRC